MSTTTADQPVPGNRAEQPVPVNRAEQRAPANAAEQSVGLADGSDAPPHRIPRSFTSQSWRDVVFLHWRVAPATVAPFMPPGTEPDVVDGSAWVGVIGLRMTDLRLGGVPWPSFLELNVRLYSRDADGNRAVVFRAMEASEPVFAGGSRLALRLPYTWAAMQCVVDDDHVSYRTRRLVPPADGAGIAFTVAPGEPLVHPSPTELALTARRSLHQQWYGPTLRVAIHHDAWPLQRARLLDLHDDGLLEACGLPPVTAAPDSVLYATATTVQFGIPTKV